MNRFIHTAFWEKQYKRFVILIMIFVSHHAMSQEVEELEIIKQIKEEISYDALLEYEIDFEQAKTFMNSEQLFECHKLFAQYFDRKSDYSRALKHSFEALEEAKNLDDLLKQGIIHLRLTNIHLDIQNPKEAISAANDAVEIFLELEDTTALIDAYNNLANANMSGGEFKKGLKWYTESLELAQQIDKQEMAMVPMSNIGAYYLFAGQADSAMPYIDAAIEFDRYDRNRANLAMAYGNKAYAYTLKSDFNLAEKYFDSSFTIANEDQLKVVQLNLFKDRSEMYFAQGNYENSYNDLVMYQRISDSLKSTVSGLRSSDWKVILDNEEKKEAINNSKVADLKMRHQDEIDALKRWTAIAISVLSLLVVISIIWILRKRSKSKN